MSRPEPLPVRRRDSAARVLAHVRALIARGELHPGDRLPTERDLAVQIGVSRPTVRAGLHGLAAMGVVESRHGSGTYIPDGPPRLDSEQLSFLAALHGVSRDEMYEARRVLEVSSAGLAAERATWDHLAAIAEEVASMFAALDDAQTFLLHDIRFHRAVAAASGNLIVATLVEMVSAIYYERRRETAVRATNANHQESAMLHRRIYQAIRARDVDLARQLMGEHLTRSSAFQAEEEEQSEGVPRTTPMVRAPAGGTGRKAHRPGSRAGNTGAS